jgi:hypothetical protein
MRTINRFLAILTVAVSLLLPHHAFMSGDRGTIQIEIVDQGGNLTNGIWFLYEGSSAQSHAVRGGTMNESIEVEPGTYFLRVENNFNGVYEAFTIGPDNPQEVVAGEEILWQIQYFKDADQIDAKPVEELMGGQVEDLVEDQVEEVVVEEATTPVKKPAKPVPTAKQPESIEVPKIETPVDTARTPLRVEAPKQPAKPATTAVVQQPVQLAVTGPTGLVGLLATSMLGGAFITRRRRKVQ